MTVAFIEEAEPEVAVALTVTFRGHRNDWLVDTPFASAAELLAAHASRDPTARHQMWLFRYCGGVCSLDLDEVAGIRVRVPRAGYVETLLKKVEELST